MSELYDVISADSARKIIQDNIHILADKESVSVDDAVGRITAETVYSPIDLPGFARSTMDGYAVLAGDTFGASESMPAYLKLAGSVKMGQPADFTVMPGTCVQIATGAMLPLNAEAVVMIEDTQELANGLIEIYKTVAQGENILLPNEDLPVGQQVLGTGKYIGAKEIGALSAVGIEQLTVYRKLQIGIISTGDELALPQEKLSPGRIRDINGPYLVASIRLAGYEPVWLGKCGDSETELEAILNKAVPMVDVVIISGGSSVGARDVTLKVIESFCEPNVLIRGIAVRPGKPTIFALAKEKPVFGLPGHPASAASIFQSFVLPALRKAAGEKNQRHEKMVAAVAAINIPSVAGREDYLKVSLQEEQGVLYATPVYGKSATITSLLNSDGIIKIPEGVEGVKKGEIVQVIDFGG